MSFRNFTEEHVKEMLNMVGEKESKNNHIKKAQFSVLEARKVEAAKEDISFLNEVELELEVELGSTVLNLREVINLFEGQVITLNRIAGDTVDLKANNNWLAHGEVLVLNEVLGIRISSFNKEDDSTRSVK
jgi:flagellar motor switch protein FliN/FliY